MIVQRHVLKAVLLDVAQVAINGELGHIREADAAGRVFPEPLEERSVQRFPGAALLQQPLVQEPDVRCNQRMRRLKVVLHAATKLEAFSQCLVMEMRPASEDSTLCARHALLGSDPPGLLRVLDERTCVRTLW
eukprot:scaffold256_cov261-Pinguiococcus_pyrenoidosus.AAC.9